MTDPVLDALLTADKGAWDQIHVLEAATMKARDVAGKTAVAVIKYRQSGHVCAYHSDDKRCVVCGAPQP